jgi:hypothetical protein
MRIVKRNSLAIGAVMAAGFLLVLLLIFSPLFGDGRNGLEYADDIFNQLSKGSSYFIPRVARASEKFIGTEFVVAIKLESTEQAERATILLAKAGAQAERKEATVGVTGDLGQLLARILTDADAGYRNDGPALSGRYDMGDKQVLATWWKVLKQMGKEFATEKKTAESKAAIAVMKKAIEPAYNYYGIEAKSAASMAATMIALLLFYVLYTIWWGSAIYFLFEGFGLAMRKEASKPAAAIGQSVEQSP